MNSLTILCLLGLLTGFNSFPHADNQQAVMGYYESSSFKAVLHLHYNHHFKQSSDFTNFEIILNELYAANQDFMDVLYTDCE